MAQPQWQVISDLIAFVFNAELECVTQLALCGCRDLCSEQNNINMAYRIQLEPSRRTRIRQNRKRRQFSM